MFRALCPLLVLAFLSIPRGASGQTSVEPRSAEETSPRSEAGARLDSLLEAAHARGILHGNVLVARDGEVVYQGEFGTADAAGMTPLTPAHRFLVGSIGKELSAVGLMVLKEQGALDLDDSVSRFLPSLPAWADRVRVRDLLTYTTGLPQVRYGVVESDADVYADLKALEALDFEPGKAYRYTNSDVFLRKRVIEAASGLSYAGFVRARLLVPCGMTDAVTDPAPDDALLAASFDAERVEGPWRSPTSGHAAVTARDLYHWTRCLHSGKVISRTSLLELARSFRKGAQSALGHGEVEGEALKRHWHHGQVASYEGLYYVSRADGLTVVLLTNSKQNQVGSLTGAIELALRGEPYEVPKKSLELALRARILHYGFEQGMALLEQIERDGRDRYDLSRVEKDLTETGEYRLEMGRASDAVRVYERAVRRFPESTTAWGGLAEARRAEAARAGGSGSLRDQLAHLDRVLFDALFAQCDAERANALLTADVEFYDDRTGLSEGDDLRDDFRRLTENCPADNGVRRILLPESVEVSPVEGFGAVQRGVHHFVEAGAATTTIATFVHVWRRVGEAWKLARIISIHRTVPAARAAELRG